MKKAIILSGLLIMASNNANCQWYAEKYLVTDIDSLAQGQLEEALKDNKKNLYVSLGVMGLGGVIVLMESLFPYTEEDDDNVTFIESLLGEKAMHKIIIASGVGVSIAGAIAGTVYLERLGTLSSARRRNFPAAGSLSLSPALILEKTSHNLYPGVTLTYKF